MLQKKKKKKISLGFNKWKMEFGQLENLGSKNVKYVLGHCPINPLYTQY